MTPYADEIRAWTRANVRARIEYRRHPSAVVKEHRYACATEGCPIGRAWVLRRAEYMRRIMADRRAGK